jgi:hypothetical protein
VVVSFTGSPFRLTIRSDGLLHIRYPKKYSIDNQLYNQVLNIVLNPVSGLDKCIQTMNV